MALAVGILTGMSIVKAYCLVAFRLHFNSKKLLLVNLLTALGYVVGMGVAFASGFWPFVFILGEAFALACFARCSNVFSEPYGKTRLFGSSLRTYVSLIASNLITYSSVYSGTAPASARTICHDDPSATLCQPPMRYSSCASAEKSRWKSTA